VDIPTYFLRKLCKRKTLILNDKER